MKTKEVTPVPVVVEEVIIEKQDTVEITEEETPEEVLDVVELPPVNEIDISLSVSSLPAEENDFDDLLREIEADLKETEKESQEVEKDITNTVITPSEITADDSLEESVVTE